MYGKTKPDFTAEHGEGSLACLLIPPSVFPWVAAGVIKPANLQLLKCSGPLQKNFQILVWAETLGGRGRKDYTIEEASSQYPLEHTTKGAWECQAVECQELATSYSKKHFRMKSRKTEITYSSCELGNRVPVQLVLKSLGTWPWTSELLKKEGTWHIYIHCKLRIKLLCFPQILWKFSSDCFHRVLKLEIFFDWDIWQLPLAEVGNAFVYLSICGDYPFWKFWMFITYRVWRITFMFSFHCHLLSVILEVFCSEYRKQVTEEFQPVRFVLRF